MVDGYVNESSVMEIVPLVVNTKLAGPITPITENSFLLPFANREEVREVAKLGTFKVSTKDGPCTLNLAYWSAELGAVGKATGEGQWVLIWNLPLHGWCWSVIERVLRPVGELISLSRMSVPHKRFIMALVRRRREVTLPMELDFSFGMRNYQVLFTVERGVFPVFRRELGRYVLPERGGNEGSGRSVECRFSHEISNGDKGKQPMRGPGWDPPTIGSDDGSSRRRRRTIGDLPNTTITILKRGRDEESSRGHGAPLT